MLLFAPAAFLLVTVFIVKTQQISRLDLSQHLSILPTHLSDTMLELMAFTAFIGAVSIWPEKIGILYALLFFSAIIAFNRLNRIYTMNGGMRQ
jgi:hypothetical protein